MVQSIRVPHDRLTGQVDVSIAASHPHDIIDDVGGFGRSISRGCGELTYTITADFAQMTIGPPEVPQAVHDDLHRLMMDRNYPEFLRALAAALEGVPHDAVKIAKPKKPRKKKAKAKPKPPPAHKRNIRFLDRG